MAIRDMDTAAAVIDVPILRARLQGLAVSSFLLAIAGALSAFIYIGSASVHSFGLNRFYQILFIIMGGLGPIRGGLRSPSTGSLSTSSAAISMRACCGTARKSFSVS